jgi:basic membrane protein A
VNDGGFVERSVEEGVDKVARATYFTRERVVVDRGATDELLDLTAGQRVDVVISSALDIDYTSVARQRPETRFVLLQREGRGPNVTMVDFADQESAFLAGAAAALTTRTGRVAFVGGVDFPLLRRFEAGYVAGAAAVDPRVTVDVRYSTTAPDFDGFANASLTAAGVRAAVDGGADVVYLPAGEAQSGGLQEVAELAQRTGRPLWAIGADQDAAEDVRWQTTATARDHVLASTVKRFDLATRSALEAHLASRLDPGRRVSDLANGELALATTGGHLDGVADRIEDLRREVVAGRIVVPCVPSGLSGAAADTAAAGPKCPPA